MVMQNSAGMPPGHPKSVSTKPVNADLWLCFDIGEHGFQQLAKL